MRNYVLLRSGNKRIVEIVRLGMSFTPTVKTKKQSVQPSVNWFSWSVCFLISMFQFILTLTFSISLDPLSLHTAYIIDTRYHFNT